MGLIALNGKYALNDIWSLQGNLYIRGLVRARPRSTAMQLT